MQRYGISVRAGLSEFQAGRWDEVHQLGCPHHHVCYPCMNDKYINQFDDLTGDWWASNGDTGLVSLNDGIECAGIQQYADVNRSSDAVSPDECGGMDQVADRNSYCETAGGTCVSVTIQCKSIDVSITAPALPACSQQHNPGFLFRLPSPSSLSSPSLLKAQLEHLEHICILVMNSTSGILISVYSSDSASSARYIQVLYAVLNHFLVDVVPYNFICCYSQKIGEEGLKNPRKCPSSSKSLVTFS
ncbi:hypothetical protein KQX54_020965 [Cotesia glomerata]|uniref:Uncharacterized protein n=1 Tax=Cotesia glomerata TaxID=32391 RepID=A0AAV7I5J6_COTGL|nr:hypothetical protein KQX54_020965 [Cotesia glomerata]